MKKEKSLLVMQAVRLAELGEEIGKLRGEMKKLIGQRAPYSDGRILAVLERFERADAEWKVLEAEHLALRERIARRESS